MFGLFDGYTKYEKFYFSPPMSTNTAGSNEKFYLITIRPIKDGLFFQNVYNMASDIVGVKNFFFLLGFKYTMNP
jgi:hypothetical protein